MKKAVFLFLSKMDFGGQERFVSRLSEMLCEVYEVYVVLFDDTEINYPIYGNVLNLDAGELTPSITKKIVKTIKRCSRLRKFLSQYRPISCFSFGKGPNLINLLSKKSGTQVLTSIRGYATAERMAKDRLDRILYPRSDRIVCVSKGIETRIRQDFPHLQGKITLLYNAYNCEQIQTLAKKAFSANLCEIRGPKLVSVGTLRPEKGYWHLIKAVFLLKRTYPAIHLFIVGSDYMQNGAHLQELIERLDLADNVTLEGWNANPYGVIANSDVYVLSSVREGFPNALVEAMACGKPVVAADCLTGPREILSNLPYDTVATGIEQAEYGILVPCLSMEEDYSVKILSEEKTLAKAIDLLLRNPILQKEYGDKALNRAMEFSYAACRNNVISLLEGNK